MRVVNPVTIEPQHLEDRYPWRTHIRAAIRFGPRRTKPRGSTRNVLTPHGATVVCVRMADAGDAMPRSLVERIDQRYDAVCGSGLRGQPLSATLIARYASASGR